VEDLVELESPTDAENVDADYRYVGLTLDRHPLLLLRERLSKMRLVPSDVLAGFSNGQLARGCGIVTVRQRPSTAKGVVFITIEDDAGTVNVICGPALVELFRKKVMGAQLLGVYGVWQCESNVRHLVAKRLVDLSHLLGELDTRSGDFHWQICHPRHLLLHKRKITLSKINRRIYTIAVVIPS
jgi:error-prone DNA polymerase